MNEQDSALAKDLARWKEKMHRLWHHVRIEQVEAEMSQDILAGSNIPLRAKIFVDEIPLDQLAVDAYFGVLDSRGSIIGGELVPLAPSEPDGAGAHYFSGQLDCRFCGRHGFMLRVMPKHPVLGPIYEPSLLVWG
nr:hypothetical protein [Geotalea toluenoxydans]